MSNDKKIENLEQILSKQIAWYKEKLELEDKGEVDSSYIYDMAYEAFQDLSRGEYLAILETLAD